MFNIKIDCTELSMPFCSARYTCNNYVEGGGALSVVKSHYVLQCILLFFVRIDAFLW